MVDVGNKTVTRRVARARALVDLPISIVDHFDKQKKEIQSKVRVSEHRFEELIEILNLLLERTSIRHSYNCGYNGG